MWPPGTHGIAPLGSWAAAMVRPVARTSSADTTPASAGSSGRDTGRSGCLSGFVRVDDEALAEQGVEGLLRRAGEPGPLHDVPHQHAVIEPRRRTLATERAVEPPVGRVQRMRVMRSARLEADRP